MGELRTHILPRMNPAEAPCSGLSCVQLCSFRFAALKRLKAGGRFSAYLCTLPGADQWLRHRDEQVGNPFTCHQNYGLEPTERLVKQPQAKTCGCDYSIEYYKTL